MCMKKESRIECDVGGQLTKGEYYEVFKILRSLTNAFIDSKQDGWSQQKNSISIVVSYSCNGIIHWLHYFKVLVCLNHHAAAIVPCMDRVPHFVPHSLHHRQLDNITKVPSFTTPCFPFVWAIDRQSNFCHVTQRMCSHA